MIGASSPLQARHLSEQRARTIAWDDPGDPMKDHIELHYIFRLERANGVSCMRDFVSVIRAPNQLHPGDILMVIEFEQML